MSGNKRGGKLAAETNRRRHGADFYARIGALGGQKGTTGGFGAGEEGRARARKYGALGGRISRRRKAVIEVVAEQNSAAAEVKITNGDDLKLAA